MNPHHGADGHYPFGAIPAIECDVAVGLAKIFIAFEKLSKSKGSFSSDQALLKILYLVTMDVTKKW